VASAHCLLNNGYGIMQIGRMNRYNDLAYLYRKNKEKEKEKEKRRIDNDLAIIKQLKLDVERDPPSNPLNH